MQWLFGSDEDILKLVGKRGSFLSRIGVAVGIRDSDYSVFKELYYEFMDHFKFRYGLNTPRRVFASVDVRRILIDGSELREYMLFLKDFVNDVVNASGLYVNFVFASFGKPKIALPGKEKPVSVKTFIESTLKSYFAYIPVWAVVSRTGIKHARIYVDSFSTSPETSAWKELCRNNEVYVVPNGDKVNLLISTADLLLGYIGTIIRLRNKKPDIGELKSYLKPFGFDNERFRIYHVGNRDLGRIIYEDPSVKINPLSYRPFPIVYLVPELSPVGLLAGRDERKLVEASPVYEYVLRYVEEREGSLKILSFTEDFKHLSAGGIMVSLGEHGKRIVEYLRLLGFPLEHLSARELVSLYGGDPSDE
ncbi:hypothetical protein [Thermococcus sp.]|uniref:hypothetical protein n=1 Tax=Thermococcus sp. TaxID=35749 RepID=UPI002610E3C5|nr:hypothetical protein [Thermococcus sp.]